MKILLNFARPLVLSWATLCLTVCSHGATVRLHGAVSMEKLFTAQKTAIESKTGATLEVVGNGTGRGLADLSAGLADIAMIGGSLQSISAVLNEEKAGSVNPAGMKEFPLAKLKLAIMTHPTVGLKSLTVAQLKDVLSGKTKNWKEAGGPDMPVKVVLPASGDGARASVQETVMKETTFAKDAIVRASSKDIGTVITQLPGSVSFVTVKNTTPGLPVVSLDQDIFMPMQLITKGEPTGAVQKVIEAAKDMIAP